MLFRAEAETVQVNTSYIYGADAYAGDAGIDTLDCSALLSSVQVALSSVAGEPGTGPGDSHICDIENIDGSAFSDTIAGNADGNVPQGLGGNARLAGGAPPIS